MVSQRPGVGSNLRRVLAGRSRAWSDISSHASQTAPVVAFFLRLLPKYARLTAPNDGSACRCPDGARRSTRFASQSDLKNDASVIADVIKLLDLFVKTEDPVQNSRLHNKIERERCCAQFQRLRSMSITLGLSCLSCSIGAACGLPGRPAKSSRCAVVSSHASSMRPRSSSV